MNHASPTKLIEELRSLPDPALDAAARSRMRSRLGLPPTASPQVRAQALSPVTHLSPRSRSSVSPNMSRRIWFSSLAVAASVLASVFLAWPEATSPEPSWSLVAGSASPSTGDPSGRWRNLGEQAQVLRLGDEIVLTVTPGAELRFSDETPRRFEVVAGEIFCTTGPAFAGRELIIETREAVATVVGTTFAMNRSALGACLCVGEGKVRFTPRRGTQAARLVSAGDRVIFAKDGTIASDGAISDMERSKLAMTREQGARMLAPSARPR